MRNYEEKLVVTSMTDMMTVTCMTGTGKSRVLGKVILESKDNLELEQLQEQVYEYGSQIKEKDYEDRNIFVFLVSLLRRIERTLGCV